MDRKALIYFDKNGKEKSYSFKDLHILSSKAANMLNSLGIKKGDRVFLYLNRSPETYIFIFAILKCGAIYCPLFPSFGADAVSHRFLDCQGSLIITEESLLENVGDFPHLTLDSEGVFYEKLLAQDSNFISPSIDKNDLAVIHYTSGTTGNPKGAVHVHGAVVRHFETSRDVLGLSRGLRYWCTADPAWVTGTSYGVFGPLSLGAETLICDIGFRAKQVLQTLEKNKIAIWYTAPTLLRMLMREKKVDFKKFDLSWLKRIFSVGEILSPEISSWVEEKFGIPVFDTWFQTETGSIMLANDGSSPIKMGSIGKPANDITIEILDNDYNILAPNKEGYLSIRPPWSSMFTSYWGREDLYKGSFKKGWYITKDLAYKDEEGYFYFLSREDDVINTAGHLLNPHEVEEILLSHDSVEEVAVSGVKDKLLGEAVKAKIVLKKNYEPSPSLQMEYRILVRNRLSPYASPQIIEFLDNIPKTESGKIKRS